MHQCISKDKGKSYDLIVRELRNSPDKYNRYNIDMIRKAWKRYKGADIS